MSKAASGLGSLKRTFSETSAADQPKAYEEQRPTKTSSSQRLKDIQEALAKAQNNASGTRQPKPFTSANASSSRPALGQSSMPNCDPVVKKPRIDNDPLSEPSLSGITRVQPNKSNPPEKSTSKPEKVDLSDEQAHVLKLVEGGTSLFYTGSAGTGKSVLLRQIIKSLRKKFLKVPEAVAVTASTGIAACNIGGTTIHSFAGIGLGLGTAEDLASKIQKNRKASGRWQRTRVLIIDEISMVDGELFDKLSRIGSILRKSIKPFGGIQVVVTGDFFQLPPVAKGGNPKFAFEAGLWNQAIKKSINLTQVFRQKDQEFVDMLNEMRFGELSTRSIARFRALAREVAYGDGIQPTELFPRREDVDRSNEARMSHIDNEDHIFPAIDGGVLEGDQREKLLSNFMAPKRLVLRKDAQVMLIKNMDDNLVNGSVGRVLRFVEPDVYGTDMDVEMGGSGREGNSKNKAKMDERERDALCPVVQFITPGGSQREVLLLRETWKVELPNGEIQASRLQFPLMLSWAMSIHKSQGQTLERVKCDLKKIFERGQAYVALSRATSLEGLQVLNFDASKVNAHPKVTAWAKTLELVK